jgi:hypothetical protein
MIFVEECQCSYASLNYGHRVGSIARCQAYNIVETMCCVLDYKVEV